MRIGRSLAVLTLLAVVAAMVGMIALENSFRAPGPLTEATVVHVPRGSGLAGTAHRLELAGVVESAELFALAAWLRGGSRSLKAGEYKIEASASMEAIFGKIRSGDVLQRRITVAEGSTTAEVVARLAENPLLAGPVPSRPPEGSLAPETYFFVRGEDRTAVLNRMQVAQSRLLGALWEDRAGELPYESPEEALVLASIIEKETALAEERRRVASVFVNRLRRGMRLQSDPTVIYGLTGGEGPLGRTLRRSDLQSDTAYNTYRVPGLPPGPICNPGRASIAAALQPEHTDYLYFVADGSGGHAFARTLKEHNRNVAQWRRIQRQNPIE